MKTRLLFAGLLLQIAAASTAADGNLALRDAWIRAAPPSAPVMAGYMTIENRTRERKTLVGATSPAFNDITIHRTGEVHGVAQMIHTPRIDIVPHGELVFQPGGYHLMLAQAKRPLRAGDEVSIEFAFADGTRASTTFVVRERLDATAGKQSRARHASALPHGEMPSHPH